MVKICRLSTVHQRDDVRIEHKECLSFVKAGYDTHLIIADGKADENFNGLPRQTPCSGSIGRF